MSLQDFASLAEIIGAIAVVITLAYLAVQIKQNSRAIRSSNETTIHINTQNLAEPLMMDRELGNIILRALSDEELPPAERLAAYAWFYQMLSSGELAHQAYVRGELDQEYWEATINFFRSYWQSPGFKRYWSNRKGAFTPKFRAAVEEWVADVAVGVTPAVKLYGAESDAQSERV